MPHGVIRELGDHEITLDLGYDIHVAIKVTVAGLQSAADVSDDGSIIEEIDEAEAAAATQSENAEEHEANAEEKPRES